MAELESSKTTLLQQADELNGQIAELQSSLELEQQLLATVREQVQQKKQQVQQQQQQVQQKAAQPMNMSAPPSSASLASEEARRPALRSEDLAAESHRMTMVNQDSQKALLAALEASLRNPVSTATMQQNTDIQQALSSLAEDAVRPQMEETHDDASLARAKRFLSSQRSSLTTRHADLQSLRQTLEPAAVQHLSTDEIVNRLKVGSYYVTCLSLRDVITSGLDIRVKRGSYFAATRGLFGCQPPFL
jgi:hypothetical protein